VGQSLSPAIPLGVGRVLDRALAFDKANRFSDARAMQQALRQPDQVAALVPAAPTPPKAAPSLAATPRRAWAWVVAGALVVVGSSLGIGIVVRGRHAISVVASAPPVALEASAIPIVPAAAVTPAASLAPLPLPSDAPASVPGASKPAGSRGHTAHPAASPVAPATAAAHPPPPAVAAPANAPPTQADPLGPRQ